MSQKQIIDVTKLRVIIETRKRMCKMVNADVFVCPICNEIFDSSHTAEYHLIYIEGEVHRGALCEKKRSALIQVQNPLSLLTDECFFISQRNKARQEKSEKEKVNQNAKA